MYTWYCQQMVTQNTLHTCEGKEELEDNFKQRVKRFVKILQNSKKTVM